MRKIWLCGAIAILGSAALAACQPYGYYGYNGYYGAYGAGPYANGPYANGPYANGQYAYGPYNGYAAPPAPPAPPPYMLPQSLSQASYNFVINVALDESFQVQAGNIARQRATSRQTRDFADQVVRGNTTLTQRLSTVLQNNGTPVTTPAALDPRHQTLINDLSVAQGPEFDRRYAVQQVVVHQETVALLQNYAQTGDNPALRQFAQQTLPAAQDGLRLAQSLPGAAAAPPVRGFGPTAAYSANCSKGVLWPFVREPGDCPTDAERISSFSPYP